MELLSLIRRKHAGLELAPREIHRAVQAMVNGDVLEYQLSALLMAICYEGLSYGETLALTEAYIDSGAGEITWEGFDQPVVDKHSTGGVGDKVSLLLAPWMAAMGMYMPKMSGRGLGHTGGTIDKLESIPGFTVDMSRAGLERMIDDVGCAVIAQTGDMVPADKKTYALRDATDTVDEIGLIAASVMSKKLVAGARHIVLDVKCGSGAFFKTESRARRFAEVAIRLGGDFDRKVACVVSNMDRPLGRAVGNALEVDEVINLLEGKCMSFDLQALCEELGSSLMILTGMVGLDERDKAIGLMRKELNDGVVLDSFKRWVTAQGGDLEEFRRRMQGIAQYRIVEITADTECWIDSMHTMAIGELARSLGAGRLTMEDMIDPMVGLCCHRKTGDTLVPGAPLATIYAKPDDFRSDSDLKHAYLKNVSFSHQPPAEQKLIRAVIGQGWEY